MTARIAVMILTHNEAIHLGRALAAVAPFAHSVHIIDCGSTDDTLTIARHHGAEVLSHTWINYATQFQWGLDHIETDADWILRLDADEFVGPDLSARVVAELSALGSDVSGVTLDQRYLFLGRFIRHGGRYPLRLLRLFRRGRGRIEQRWMDEHIHVTGGRIAHLPGDFTDNNLKGLGFFIDKHNGYATREAIDVLDQRLGLFAPDPASKIGGTSRQASVKRWVKLNIYNRLPFPLAAFGYFLLRYVVQLGFLDGLEGLCYHSLQGFWYRFLVGAKTLELKRAIAHLSDKSAIRAELARRTGLNLDGRQVAPSIDGTEPDGAGRWVTSPSHRLQP